MVMKAAARILKADDCKGWVCVVAKTEKTDGQLMGDLVWLVKGEPDSIFIFKHRKPFLLLRSTNVYKLARITGVNILHYLTHEP